MNTCVSANNGKNDIIIINKHLFNNIITQVFQFSFYIINIIIMVQIQDTICIVL